MESTGEKKEGGEKKKEEETIKNGLKKQKTQ
jgi:hypothetical protein